MILLPLVSFVSLVLYLRIKFPSFGWRLAYILAAVALVSTAVLFLEGASIFAAVTLDNVRLFWIVVTLSTAGLCAWHWRARTVLFANLPRLGRAEILLGFGAGAILLVNAAVAFIAPPNNWDSMTYHLPRVMHWAANGSVHPYPASIDRQVLYSPGAEYCLLHAYWLTGDDRWFNALQWLSLAGCAVAASLVAKYLGARILGQVLAAVVTATIPMAILQSTGTQNDLYLSFWAMAFVGLGMTPCKKFSRTLCYAGAAAMGLAILAKGTFFVVLAFVVWFAFRSWLIPLRHWGVACCIILALTGGYCSRSIVAHHNGGLSSIERAGLLLPRHDPAAVIANALCQTASELAMSLSAGGQAVIRAAARASGWVGVDVKDPGVLGFAFFASPRPLRFAFDEDYAPDPWHMTLVILLPLLLWSARVKRDVWLYYACAAGGWALFFGLIRWQDWITRLHLPLFILCAPLVAVAVERSRRVAVGVGGLLVVLAFTVIFSHATRPLVGANHLLRWERGVYYFMKKPKQVDAYFKVADGITSSGCRDVGLVEGADSWEYPLWALTGYGRVKFRAVNEPGDHAAAAPCLVVTLDSPRTEHWHAAGEDYHRIMDLAPLQVFAPAAREH